MRTTVDIESHLLKRLRAEAQRRGVSFKELLQGIIRRGLEDRPPGRSRYRAPSFSLGNPERTLSLDRALALAATLEDDELARKLSLRK
jgi:hypothetical protein